MSRFLPSTRQMPMLVLSPFLSTFFLFYYSRTSLYVDAVQSELRRAALNKLLTYFTSLSFLNFRVYFNLSLYIFAISWPHHSLTSSFYFFILLIIYTIFSHFFSPSTQFTSVSVTVNCISKNAFDYRSKRIKISEIFYCFPRKWQNNILYW